MANTTNFGWETPDDTDLVKDGAAAMRTLGNSIDASFVDLKGGTTGQVLAKASNTDLDFTWSASGIPASIFDAKGDLIAASGADTAARLPVGANGTVLTAASGETTGLQWVAPYVAPTGYSLLNAGGTALTGAQTITVSGLSAKALMIIIIEASSASASSAIRLRLNGDTANNYTYAGQFNTAGSTYAASNFTIDGSYSGSGEIPLATMSSNASSQVYASISINLTDTTGWKPFIVTAGASAGGGNSQIFRAHQGIYEASAAITSIDVISQTGNFDGGTVYVLGAN